MIYIGKLVNTHGIKGEVKIISDIDYKKEVFKKGNHLYVNDDKLTINNYRTHKNFDMVIFEEITDINEALKYKNCNVYIDKNEIKNITLNEELIGYDVYSNRYIGKVSKLMKNKKYDILVIENNEKEYLVPKIKEFVIKIDSENKKIIINEIEGLINEN